MRTRINQCRVIRGSVASQSRPTRSAKTRKVLAELPLRLDSDLCAIGQHDVSDLRINQYAVDVAPYEQF